VLVFAAGLPAVINLNPPTCPTAGHVHRECPRVWQASGGCSPAMDERPYNARRPRQFVSRICNSTRRGAARAAHAATYAHVADMAR